MTYAIITEARRGFHASLLKRVLRLNSKGVPSNADSSSRISIAIATGILERLGSSDRDARLAGQTAGADFESICCSFVELTFRSLQHLRPGVWHIGKKVGTGAHTIARFEQYRHLADLVALSKDNPELAAALGSDYLIKPDVVIAREPEPDENINVDTQLVDLSTAHLTSLRAVNQQSLILHANISCKWTLRSDRAQNARSEGLSLVRNRKGRLPHIAVVTGEPMPSRIASIALGTGEVDCVYHFALSELQNTIEELGYEDSKEILDTMVGGQRLRDIADLPLDLAI